MGSYCELEFDGINILSAKSAIPDNLCALFQDSDRVVHECPETEEVEAHRVTLYDAPRAVILSRLELLGYTGTIVQERFDRCDVQRI
jgi:hypothetical protein